MAVSLTSDLLIRMASTHIWHGRNQSSHHEKMAQPLHLTYSSEWLWIQHSYLHGRNQSSHHDRMAQPLHLTMEGTNPITMSEWLMDSSLSLRGNLDLKNAKLLLELLKLHSGQWIRQHISYLFVRCNILECHCSSLHHIPDIVILDLDMLWLVMEHWILWQLHTTLVVTMYTSSIQLEIKLIKQVASSAILPHN